MPVLNIDTIAVEVVGINDKRRKIHLQNTGEEKIYFKKQDEEDVPAVPTTEDYDFILYPSEGGKKETPPPFQSDEHITEKTIYTTSRFNAISEGDGSTLAYMETNFKVR